MKDDLFRVESAVSATSSGNLTWDRWTLDVAVALGLSGQRNPLGFAVVRYLSDTPSAMAVWNVVLILAKEMQKRGVASDGINEVSFQAFEAWKDTRCPSCGGRGVAGIEQSLCLVCKGTGKRPVPESPDALRIGLGCLLEAESWMEGQLASRMRDALYQSDEPGFKVNLPRRDNQDDIGFNRDPRTPSHKSEC